MPKPPQYAESMTSQIAPAVTAPEVLAPVPTLELCRANRSCELPSAWKVRARADEILDGPPCAVYDLGPRLHLDRGAVGRLVGDHLRVDGLQPRPLPAVLLPLLAVRRVVVHDARRAHLVAAGSIRVQDHLL
eukprot:6655731-Pyramimonas_sp.AAC.1